MGRFSNEEILAYADALPGGGIFRKGLRDLASHTRSEEALLLLIAKPRLSRQGLVITDTLHPQGCLEHNLYELLQERHADPYGRYNSLLRELVSFEDAVESLGQSVSG